MSETLMFDFSAFYDRIANELPDDCKVCEIGVANGDSALYLAKKLNELGKNFKLYMVDNMDYGGYDQMKTIYQNIIETGLGEHIEIIPTDSVSASKIFNDDSLHFVFLDSSHEYQETKDSILVWTPKLVDDCIMAGHDYFEYEEVHKAVNEIVPFTYKREAIETQDFKYEQVLYTENTTNGYGIFYFKKKFYIKFNS